MSVKLKDFIVSAIREVQRGAVSIDEKQCYDISINFECSVYPDRDGNLCVPSDGDSVDPLSPKIRFTIETKI